MTFGLSQKDLDFIVNAIGHYGDVEEAVIFGSRALGNHKDTSDIDIALKGNLQKETAGLLSGFLNNASPFLYKVDVLDYGRIENEALKRHIDEMGKSTYRKIRT